MALDNIIFGDKTLADMFADVYKNTSSKREQLNEFIVKLTKLIRTPEDAVMIAPVIREFFDVHVKNDEHIVRLVQIAQRLSSVSSKTASGEDMLTDAEKEQLIKNVKEDFLSVIDEMDDIEDRIKSLK